jgi:ribosomal protein L40E
VTVNSELVCWRCGAPLSGLPLPLGRTVECESCHADLHVCRMCEFYAPGVSKQCRETVAEEVRDKERANFCDYFRPLPGAYSPRDDSALDRARAGLDALFGNVPLEKGDGTAGGEAPTEADIARQRLEKLFGSGKGPGD